MSHKQNDQWLEAAKENFDTAIEEGNYALCKDIIADVQEVSLEAGRSLNEQLRNTPVEKFNIKSFIQPQDL
jgi:hypothetical protein